MVDFFCCPICGRVIDKHNMVCGYEVEVIWESDINIELIKTILIQHNIKFYAKNS